ncbi:3-deoxy-D-manno-octulosonic acid transferase [Vibrio sp. V27_P1S3P104]|uniref:lipid IV(A) 3-deoxy-D-manno-octulosonic acid transferase n=1 Tax=unclassified Vibrio TaxID=2614977 RepID=UPI001372E59B|nr:MULTISPECIES: lipid IV(A) 3-deoxy-D-manno-octulosonic acid transferase [unclassified Vibrio]NAW70316.1 3-deoxy-D-manno-octulosonic acid transferase [Vibrio sp. V28_P6S34P95]NAX06070.1 3-deoxy-D-manno-octulosonic acid transferase [Vibrio sp. V30_P3S12P165]NAX35670.1 3-deoxy-D-manno-octulosonic acid transferase [Vibrio sp. V29_P1S30P107]NAX36269.1 3-deoxy-D-manno-octulosonic acid transferase [Vibrio sp. V27_P1S3P104]NAX39312.1 3-deoxy-D-manno-octulosonic acid transferase [Vibrio sp. V26_P1S5P
MLIRALYTFLLLIAAPFMLYGLYKKRAGKPAFGRRWKEHFGITPKRNAADKPLWIHAVSVGEAIAATPIIQAIKERQPNLSIVVTTTTSTGAEQIEKLSALVEHRYMPLDFPLCINGFLNAIQPSQLLIMETELWPNTLHCVATRNIPITVINARLSERSCRRYQRFQSIFHLLSQHISQLLCQYQSDAERFLRLGIDSHKISVMGSIKFDITVTDEIRQQGRMLREQLGQDRPIWIAASTHQGEDEMCLAAHRQLLSHYPDALLILVPRHPERFNSVDLLCRTQDFTVSRRTEPMTEPTEIYLGDTMGEMLTLIGSADICFMAGSLLGNKVGGHNPLEPAALAKPILNGPSYYNFSQVTEGLLTADAVMICHSASEISAALVALFGHPARMQAMGQRAQQVVEENRGALEKTVQAILSPTHYSA